VEVEQSQETAERSPARSIDEGSTQERNLRQKNVKMVIFSNKLIMNLEKEKIIESKK
jgi:hypothetical protein